MPESQQIQAIQPDSDGPLFSDFVKQRDGEWWGRKHEGVHASDECKNTLISHTDNDKLWHCCPFWQRKLANKLNSREFAVRCGVNVPTLYWFGKDPAEIPFHELPAAYVVKTSTGWNADQVLPIENGRSVLKGRDWSTDLIVDRFHRIMSRKQFSGGYVFVEELVRDGSGTLPRDYKCYVFDGRVGMLSVIDRLQKSAARYLGDGTTISQPMHALDNAVEPADLPENFDQILRCAEKLARNYGNTFIRVDLYCTRQGVTFGEFCATPGGGRGFSPSADRMLGAMWDRMLKGEPPC